MAGLGRTIPALLVRDITTAVAHFRDRLGFGPIYVDDGFAVLQRDRDRVHVWQAGGPADVSIQGWSLDGTADATRRRVTLRLKQCGTQWRALPGGLVYSRPQCAPVRVTVGDRSRLVRFGLGQNCPPKR